MIAVARGDPDVSRVGVDVERATHEPLVAHHVAAVGVYLDVALLEEDRVLVYLSLGLVRSDKVRLGKVRQSLRLGCYFKKMEGCQIDIINA